MENRSHALLAGSFTLLLLIAAIAIAIIINRDHVVLSNYDIVSDSAVSGLSAQSVVRYQGVLVGKVISLGLDPATPRRVRIRIGITPETPITQSTWAELATQGVTGLASIDLRDDGRSHVRHVPNGKKIALIPMRPGLFERFSTDGNAILHNLTYISNQLVRTLNPQNLQALSTSLENAASISTSLKLISLQLTPVARKIGPLVDNLHHTVQAARVATHNIDGLVHQTRQSLTNFERPDGPLNTLMLSLRDISYATLRLSNETLPAMTTMANQVSIAARRVIDTPQSILFGAPAPQAGPGEQGFGGFAHKP